MLKPTRCSLVKQYLGKRLYYAENISLMCTYNYDVDLLMMSRDNARNMQRSLINILYVNKQEFSASSWRSNQGYTKMHSQPTIKIMCILLVLLFY